MRWISLSIWLRWSSPNTSNTESRHSAITQSWGSDVSTEQKNSPIPCKTEHRKYSRPVQTHQTQSADSLLSSTAGALMWEQSKRIPQFPAKQNMGNSADLPKHIKHRIRQSAITLLRELSKRTPQFPVKQQIGNTVDLSQTMNPGILLKSPTAEALMQKNFPIPCNTVHTAK